MLDDHGVHPSGFFVLGSCSGSVRGSVFEVRGSRFEVRGSRFEVRSQWGRHPDVAKEDPNAEHELRSQNVEA
jgi:hypothetical protein